MVFGIIFWSVFGAVGWIILGCCLKVPGPANTEGIEFVNPKQLYKHVKVNWFGAFFLSTLYSVMCPIGTAIYWFYKLCTVGRK